MQLRFVLIHRTPTLITKLEHPKQGLAYTNMRFVEEVEEADLNDAKRSDAKQYFFIFFNFFINVCFFNPLPSPESHWFGSMCNP